VAAPAIGTLTTEADLERLADEWDALAAACPRATPFQTPAWALPWRRHLGRGRLLVLTARHEDRLVGLLPLEVRRWCGLRRAVLLGSGVSDALGPLLHPEHAAATAPALWAALEAAGGWDLCDLCQLDGPHAPPGAAQWPHEDCLRLSLAGPAPDRGAYALRRLTREGARVEAAPDPEAFLPDLFRLHAARWRSRGLPGVFASARVRAFHREAAAALAARGRLRAWVLRLGERVIAAHYGFRFGPRVCYYAGGFDPAWARLSPGTALVGHAVAAARAEGAREFDFLRGDEPYKAGWGARAFPLRRAVLARGPARAALPLLRAAEAAEGWAKRAVRR